MWIGVLSFGRRRRRCLGEVSREVLRLLLGGVFFFALPRVETPPAKLFVRQRAAAALSRECLARSLETWRGVVYGSDPYTGTVS